MRTREEAKAISIFTECLPKITVYLEKISIALTIIALQTETQETKDELHNKRYAYNIKKEGAKDEKD